MPGKIIFAAVLFLSSQVSPARSREAEPLTASQFAGIIQRISEEGGYFWNDNYVSNEASYLHPLTKLRELGIRGGIYIGVGPNQNFTYIAKLHPRYAFVLDIRRQNLLEHLLFKALFHLARDRRDFLSLLLSRPITRGSLTGDSYTVQDMVRYFQMANPDASLSRRTLERVHLYLTTNCRVSLSDLDWQTMGKIHQAFFYRGLSIKYDYIPVPTFGEFLTERDLEGKMQDFLNSTQDFRYLKRLQEENRIIPIVGDFAGSHALRELGRYLRERDERVTVFYTSNVEQYLVRNNAWARFLKNVGELPLDDRAVFIRAYWSTYISHPEGVAGYRFTQILQWIKPFLREFNPNLVYSYWDIVTTNTIKLH
ncbi:MAG TPA: hypothetical protein VE398_06915 [Acidobacteriota bacterium]|nr:hypothetical protein [Acidobacteriota bacterium]